MAYFRRQPFLHADAAGSVAQSVKKTYNNLHPFLSRGKKQVRLVFLLLIELVSFIGMFISHAASLCDPMLWLFFGEPDWLRLKSKTGWETCFEANAI